MAKLALQDKNPMLCETYFELQRRAYYGNKYFPIEEMSEIEQEMWGLGTGEMKNIHVKNSFLQPIERSPLGHHI